MVHRLGLGVGGAHHYGPVRRHGHVEDPLGVAEQLGDLGHGGVLPDGDLVPGSIIHARPMWSGLGSTGIKAKS